MQSPLSFVVSMLLLSRVESLLFWWNVAVCLVLCREVGLLRTSSGLLKQLKTAVGLGQCSARHPLTPMGTVLLLSRVRLVVA